MAQNRTTDSKSPHESFGGDDKSIDANAALLHVGSSEGGADRFLLRDYQSALIASKTGVWVHHTPGNHIYVDPLMLRVLGYSPEDVGSSLEEWNRRTLHPDDFDAWRDTYRAHLEGRTPIYEHTHRRRHKDGTYRWLFSRGRAEIGDDGRVVRMLGIATDITELQQTRDSLRESEAILRQFAEHSSDVFWSMEAGTGRLLYVSPALERLVGHSALSFTDGTRRWQDVIVPEDRERVLAMDLCAREGDWEVTCRVTHADGTQRWVQVQGFAVRARGQTDRIAGVMKDITQARAEDDRRLAAQRQQSDLLLREVHHRIKNSLQGITGLLAIHMREHPEVAKPLGDAVTQVESIALVHGLMGAHGDGDIDPVVLTRAIVEATRKFVCRDLDIELEVRERARTRVARDKSVAVALTLNELLTNALKHRRNGNPVRVALDVVSGRIAWRLSNSGALAEAADFRSGRGLGIGLSLVRSMLPAAGGHIALGTKNGEVHADLSLEPPLITTNEEPR